MIALIPIATILTAALTVLIRRMAIKKSQLDIPNERSSHTKPTPRGAGMAVVISYVICLIVMLLTEKISNNLFLTLTVPSVFVAIIGRLDDLGRLTSVRWRLTGHFFAATVAVWFAGWLPPLPIASSAIDFGVFGNIIAVIYLVWMLNLFNFMDGIDLITGIETLTTCFAIAILLASEQENNLWMIAAILAASVLGFMFFNIPPAKIFLGDVGSGFIGFVFATFSIVIANENALIAWSLLILLAVFVVDATVTLLRRIFTRQNVSVAHRSHAYQYLSGRTKNHLSVSVGVGMINLIWLLPIAWLVTTEKLTPIFGVLIAYVPLIIIAFFLKAGKQLAN